MSETEPAADQVTDRQRQILQLVSLNGFATIEALARHFDVSTQTIRRDIIRLDELQLLQRFHGGAGLREAAGTADPAGEAETVRLGYVQKQQIAADAKMRIASAAAALIGDGASLFLDVGTTVEAAARALRDRQGLRIFTCSMRTAMLLAEHNGNEVFVTGGLVRGADGSLVGEATLEAIARFRPDYALLGFSGIDNDGAIMDFDLQKVAAKQAMLAAARQSFMLGDATKFDRSSLVRVTPLERLSGLVTDQTPPVWLEEKLGRTGVRLVVG